MTREVRWKLAPVEGEWDLVFRVELPKRNEEKNDEEDDQGQE